MLSTLINSWHCWNCFQELLDVGLIIYLSSSLLLFLLSNCSNLGSILHLLVWLWLHAMCLVKFRWDMCCGEMCFLFFGLWSKVKLININLPPCFSFCFFYCQIVQICAAYYIYWLGYGRTCVWWNSIETCVVVNLNMYLIYNVFFAFCLWSKVKYDKH